MLENNENLIGSPFVGIQIEQNNLSINYSLTGLVGHSTGEDFLPITRDVRLIKIMHRLFDKKPFDKFYVTGKKLTR